MINNNDGFNEGQEQKVVGKVEALDVHKQSKKRILIIMSLIIFIVAGIYIINNYFKPTIYLYRYVKPSISKMENVSVKEIKFIKKFECTTRYNTCAGDAGSGRKTNKVYQYSVNVDGNDYPIYVLDKKVYKRYLNIMSKQSEYIDYINSQPHFSDSTIKIAHSDGNYADKVNRLDDENDSEEEDDENFCDFFDEQYDVEIYLNYDFDEDFIDAYSEIENIVKMLKDYEVYNEYYWFDEAKIYFKNDYHIVTEATWSTFVFPPRQAGGYEIRFDTPKEIAKRSIKNHMSYYNYNDASREYGG